MKSLMAGRGRSAVVLALTLAAGALFYALTICRTVYWGDGLELTVAAYCLGIAHPSGYPLFTLIGRIFLWLPFGTPGLRMNLFCALSALAASGLFYGLCGEFFRLLRPKCDVRSWNLVALRSGIALSLSLSSVLWKHAVVTEVYAPLTAAMVGCLWLVVRTYRTRTMRCGLAMMFVYGIVWQCHLLAVVLAPAVGAAALCALLERRRQWRQESEAGLRNAPKRWGVATLTCGMAFCFALGLSGYGGMLLRARSNPTLNWGDPSSPGRLALHLSGGQYKQTRVLTDARTKPLHGYALRKHLREQSYRVFGWPLEQFSARLHGAVLVASGAAGLFWAAVLAVLGWLLWRRTLLGLGLIGSLILGIGVLLVYTIVDIEAYFLAIWPLALMLFWGALQWDGGKKRLGWVGRLAPAILAWALVVCAALSNFALCDVSGEREADEYGRRLLADDLLPQGALLLTNDDNTIYAVWYQQIVEGRRPDVTAFGLNFIFRGWYGRHFEREENLSVFTCDLPPTESFPDFLVALGGGVVGPNIQRRPVCVANQDPQLIEWFLCYFKAQHLTTLRPYDLKDWRPLFFTPPPAADLYLLQDNPEYRIYQEKQFEDIYGAMLDKDE